LTRRAAHASDLLHESYDARTHFSSSTRASAGRIALAAVCCLFILSACRVLWRPDREPRAVALIVHGFNSHSGYYEWTAAQLIAAGYAVYALDLHGRGESEGERLFTETSATTSLTSKPRSHSRGRVIQRCPSSSSATAPAA
jgi:pimeloyl-ACP methyl ester carboxylesterase